jgi:hypothetical protein
MQSGDVRQSFFEHGTYTWPSTSGNAFPAAVLRRLMPIPEHVYRGQPDIYLCNLSALFGQVISLEKPGALYRVHGGNNYTLASGSVDIDSFVDRWKTEFLSVDDAHIRIKGLFSTLYSLDASSIKHPQDHDWYSLCQRMTSLKLDRPNHPISETLWAPFVQGCVLFVSRPDPWSRKLYYLLWLAAMLLAPKPLTWPLVRALENTGWLKHKLVFRLWR